MCVRTNLSWQCVRTHACTCVCKKLSKGSVLNFGSTFYNFLVICWVHCICKIGTLFNLRGRIRIKMYARYLTHRMGSVSQTHWALKSVASALSVVSRWWHGRAADTSFLQEWVTPHRTLESLGKGSGKANGNCVSCLSWGICTQAKYGNLDLQILGVLLVQHKTCHHTLWVWIVFLLQTHCL